MPPERCRCELLRIPLPRTWVNMGKAKAGCYQPGPRLSYVQNRRLRHLVLHKDGRAARHAALTRLRNAPKGGSARVAAVPPAVRRLRRSVPGGTGDEGLEVRPTTSLKPLASSSVGPAPARPGLHPRATPRAALASRSSRPTPRRRRSRAGTYARAEVNPHSPAPSDLASSADDRSCAAGFPVRPLSRWPPSLPHRPRAISPVLPPLQPGPSSPASRATTRARASPSSRPRSSSSPLDPHPQKLLGDAFVVARVVYGLSERAPVHAEERYFRR